MDDEAAHREFQLALASDGIEEWHLLVREYAKIQA